MIAEIKRYGKYEADIANGTDDSQISMDGLQHSYDTVFINDDSAEGILIRLGLDKQAYSVSNSEFTLAAGDVLAFNDWNITAIAVSNHSGSSVHLRVIMGGE